MGRLRIVRPNSRTELTGIALSNVGMGEFREQNATLLQQLVARLDRMIDWFIPAELAAERETRQRARMFLISHLLGPFLGNVMPAAFLS